MATMNQMETIVRRAVRCAYNVMFLSQPALGKTTKINEIVTDLQTQDPTFFFMHMDGGTLAPTDVVMAMPDMAESVVKKLVDGRLPNAYSLPDLRGLIYVGEWPLMGMETSRGFQKLINHEDIGGFRIPDNVIFVSDGNRLRDRSGGQQQTRSIMSRFMCVELEYDTDYALNVAKHNFHERVAAFLLRNPQYADNYADVFENEARGANDVAVQEGKLGIWASLRSWERVSRIMADRDVSHDPILPDEITRNVGKGIAQTFDVFQGMLDNLATIEQIMAAPKNAKVPDKMDERYALSTMLALTTQVDTFKAISIYMRRFPGELQACYFRLLNDKLDKATEAAANAVRSSMDYKVWVTEPQIAKLLQGAA
jgi:hypothetical protein